MLFSVHFDIHCQACASYVRVRVWVGVRVSVEFSYLFNQARCTDVSARSHFDIIHSGKSSYLASFSYHLGGSLSVGGVIRSDALASALILCK